MASTSTTATQIRDHGSHSASHENSYLTSTNKNDAGVKITRIGLYVNLGMAIAKGIGGYYFHSKALTADAVHSLTDLVSDVMTLATVSWALKPPSEKFPSGYGKVESLGSLGVSGILLAGGILMGWSAVLQLAQEFVPGFAMLAENLGLIGHSHSHGVGADELGPNINAAWLAGGSILIKEWLYRATNKIALERKSSVLAANAYHHRVDSLTAFVALLMIAGSNVLENAAWMDPIGGLVISLMVIQAGLGNTKNSVLELIDVNIDPGMRRRVRKAADSALEEMKTGSKGVEIRNIEGVKAGQTYLLDVELGVPSSWTVDQIRNVEDAVRLRIGAKVRGVKRVRVTFEAIEGPEKDEFIPADISPRSSVEPESEDEKEHEHEHANGHNHPHNR